MERRVVARLAQAPSVTKGRTRVCVSSGPALEGEHSHDRREGFARVKNGEGHQMPEGVMRKAGEGIDWS